MAISVGRLPADFQDWDGLMSLIVEAFAYMDGVIDPPSSIKRLTTNDLARKAQDEACFVAKEGGRIVGCIFVHERADHAYIGKMAVAPPYQGRAVGKALMQAAEGYARDVGKPVLELQTRIELTGNQAAFTRLGFHETLRSAHAGHDRPTTITMRKTL